MNGLAKWQRANGSIRAAIYCIGLGVALAVSVASCHKTPPDATAVSTQDQNGADPADANMAPTSAAQTAAPQQPARVLGQRSQNEAQQQAEDYTPQQQQAAPIERRAPDQGGQANDAGAAGAPMSDTQAADVYASDLTDEQSTQPPPPLPDYDQPPAPEPDDLWTPGYWGWGSGGYYWVPGVWVGAPYPGALWTPGYWGYAGNVYRFHRGFWGLHIGFYGGVDYGFGYTGHGYYGGYWNHDHFFYNTAVNHVNVNTVRNVYVHNVVINNVTVNNRIVDHVSYNGGRGGVSARPLPAEVAVLHEQRNAPMAAQLQVRQQAESNRAQLFSENHGRPAMAVAARPVAADRTPPPPLPRLAAPNEPRQNLTPSAAIRPQPGARAQEAPQNLPRPNPQPQGAARPAFNPQERQPQPAATPQPQNRQQPNGQPPNGQPRPSPGFTPQPRPVQPAPAPQDRPAPQVRPTPPPQPAPRVDQHPAPAPQSRPAPPQPHAAAPQPRPQPQPHTAPPAPAPAAHPEPERPR